MCLPVYTSTAVSIIYCCLARLSSYISLSLFSCTTTRNTTIIASILLLLLLYYYYCSTRLSVSFTKTRSAQRPLCQYCGAACTARAATSLAVATFVTVSGVHEPTHYVLQGSSAVFDCVLLTFVSAVALSEAVAQLGALCLRFFMFSPTLDGDGV